MSIIRIIKKLPEYATDIKQNLLDIFESNSNPHLSQRQIYSISLTIGYSLKHEQLLNSIRTEAKMYLEDVDATACKIAAMMMAMNNTYYNFVHSISDDKLANMPPELQMYAIDNPGIDPIDFKILCLAVSILNSCKYCMDVHVKLLLKNGVSNESIREVGKIVAVLRATSDAFEIERMRSYDFLARDASIN